MLNAEQCPIPMRTGSKFCACLIPMRMETQKFDRMFGPNSVQNWPPAINFLPHHQSLKQSCNNRSLDTALGIYLQDRQRSKIQISITGSGTEPGLGVGLLTAGRMLGIYMSELWTVVILSSPSQAVIRCIY